MGGGGVLAELEREGGFGARAGDGLEGLYLLADVCENAWVLSFALVAAASCLSKNEE